MRSRVVATEVEPYGGREVARLLAVVDPLDIDVAAGGRREVQADAREFLLKARDVEPVGVEPGKVAVAEELENILGLFGERRAVLDYFVRNAVYLRRLRRNRNRRVEEPAARLLRSVREELHGGELDYAVLARRYAGGLYIEYDEGSVKL